MKQQQLKTVGQKLKKTLLKKSELINLLNFKSHLRLDRDLHLRLNKDSKGRGKKFPKVFKLAK